MSVTGHKFHVHEVEMVSLDNYQEFFIYQVEKVNL